MRVLFDMNEAQVAALDALAKEENISRAALIRRAIDEYLRQRRCEQVEDGFALWGRRKVDGLEYQEGLRSEW